MAITDREISPPEFTGPDGDRRLVEAHRGGNPDAFPELVRANYGGLLAHGMRRLGDLRAAEDAVQETLLRAYRGLATFNGDYRLQPWLHRILTNVCHDEGDRRRREAAMQTRLSSAQDELSLIHI